MKLALKLILLAGLIVGGGLFLNKTLHDVWNHGCGVGMYMGLSSFIFVPESMIPELVEICGNDQ